MKELMAPLSVEKLIFRSITGLRHNWDIELSTAWDKGIAEIKDCSDISISRPILQYGVLDKGGNLRCQIIGYSDRSNA